MKQRKMVKTGQAEQTLTHFFFKSKFTFREQIQHGWCSMVIPILKHFRVGFSGDFLGPCLLFVNIVKEKYIGCCLQ